MSPVYYVREIEKVMIATMDVFNNLRVKRYDDQNRTMENRTVAVPLYSHNSDDFANYVSSTATAQEPMPVPCAGFRYVSNRHDETHMVQPTYAREILAEDIEKFVRDIQPTPMTITFELTVLSDNLADFFFLKEQIEPYFNTYRTVRIKEWDFAPKIERPIPFKITWSDNLDDEKGDTSNEYQFYKTTYTIEAIAVYHRPYELPAIIKYAQMNFIVNNEYQDSLQVFVYPDEIGTPTTSISKKPKADIVRSRTLRTRTSPSTAAEAKKAAMDAKKSQGNKDLEPITEDLMDSDIEENSETEDYYYHPKMPSFISEIFKRLDSHDAVLKKLSDAYGIIESLKSQFANGFPICYQE